MKKRIAGILLLILGIAAMLGGVILTVRQVKQEEELNQLLNKAVQDFDSVLPGLKKGFVNTDGSEEPLPFMIVDGFKCVGLCQITETDTSFIIRKEDILSGTPATGNFHIDHSYEDIGTIEEGMQISVTDIKGYVYTYTCDSVQKAAGGEPEGNLVIHYEGMATKYIAVCTVD